MKEFLQNYKDYLESRKGAKDAYDAERNEIKANYIGKMLDTKLSELDNAHDEIVRGLKGDIRMNADKTFKTVRDKIMKVASEPVPSKLSEQLKSMEGTKLSDAETSMVIELCKRSYLASKRAIDIFGVDSKFFPPSLDTVLGSVQTLETLVNKCLTEPFDSYNNRVIAHGELVNSVSDDVDAFCNGYKE